MKRSYRYVRPNRGSMFFFLFGRNTMQIPYLVGLGIRNYFEISILASIKNEELFLISKVFRLVFCSFFEVWTGNSS